MNRLEITRKYSHLIEIENLEKMLNDLNNSLSNVTLILKDDWTKIVTEYELKNTFIEDLKVSIENDLNLKKKKYEID